MLFSHSITAVSCTHAVVLQLCCAHIVSSTVCWLCRFKVCLPALVIIFSRGVESLLIIIKLMILKGFSGALSKSPINARLGLFCYLIQWALAYGYHYNNIILLNPLGVHSCFINKNIIILELAGKSERNAPWEKKLMSQNSYFNCD